VRARTTAARRVPSVTAAILVVVAGTWGPAACGDDAASPGTVRDGHAAHATASSTTASPATPLPATGPFTVTATEYAFDGLPATMAAGPQTINFTNRGTEPHELFLYRNTEGRSVDELFAMGPIAVQDHVQVGGKALVGPGQTADPPLQVDLAPGDWEAICFMPAAGDGRPHADHGMHALLRVQ
jgi:hypothetical protein